MTRKFLLHALNRVFQLSVSLAVAIGLWAGWQPVKVAFAADLLTVTQTAAPSPVLLGNNLTYTVTVRNPSTTTRANSVVMTDTLPVSVTFVSMTTTKGTCTRSSNVVTCNLGRMNRNTSVTITIVVTPTTAGVITNTATATTTSNDTIPGNNTSSLNTTVNPKTDLSISKTDAPDPVYVGNALNYTLVITNSGPSNATGVTVTDTLPANVMFVSASSGCAPSGGTVVCAVGALSASITRTLTMTVTPTAAATGTITNTAVVAGNETDLTAANNTATASTLVRPQANLSVSQTAAPSPAYLSNLLTYTIVTGNNGPSAASGVVLTDTLPAGVTFASASAGCSASSGVVSCTVGAIANGASVTTTIRVTPTVLGPITNTVTAAGVEFDPNAANNTSTLNSTVIPAADLSITKSVTPAVVLVGETLTYTIAITNNGPTNANTVVMTDTLPGAVNFSSLTTSQGTCSGASAITCSLGALNGGASAIITIRVVTTAEGTITNTSTVSSDVVDPNSANNAATVVSAVNPVDLSVSKTASSNTIMAGNRLTYTVVLTNTGPMSGPGVLLTDNLPASVTPGSVATTQGTCSGVSAITCTIGTMNVGSVVTVTIAVTPTTTGDIINTASVSGTYPDPNPANNTATATTAVNPANLSISKAATPNPVYDGDAITYTLNITNSGPANASGVTVTDTLPANVTFVSASAGCTPSGGTVSCSVGALANGGSRTFTMTVTPDPGVFGVITNTAVVGGNEPDVAPANNTASAATTVLPKANLSVSKTDGPDPAYVGNGLTYTVTVNNAGPSLATNVVLTDTLPVGVTFSSASAGCSEAGGTVTCTVGAIANGASTSVNIVITPTNSAIGTITNTASAVGSEFDPGLANNTATASTVVNPQADLIVTKTASPDPAQSGSALVYTIVVTNNGPSTAAGVTVTDTLPAGVNYNSSSAGCSQAAGIVTCAMGSIANGASKTVTITVTPPGSTSGTTITNDISVTSATFDPDLTNNTDSLNTTVDPADLALMMTDAPDPVVLGNALTYTLVVTNFGPSNATGVLINDTLPGTVTFNSASAGCTFASGIVTCDLTNMNVSTSTTVTITVTPTTSGSTTNSATVDSDEADNNPANDTASATTTVNALANLSISKSASPEPVYAGAPLTYTLSAANSGPHMATSVVVTDVLPAGETFGGASGAGWSCGESGGVVTCSQASLSVGPAANIIITVTAPANAGVITNTATITSTAIDTAPGNNSASASTTVLNNPPAFVSTPVTSATVGATCNYAITATDPDVSDALTITALVKPAWLTLTDNGNGTATLSGTPTSTDVGANAVTLQVSDTPGATAAQTFTVTVADQPIGGLAAANSGPVVYGSATDFTATLSAGSNVSYQWDFGDGQTGAGANTTHTYANAGTYTATVTASNGAGNASATTTVTVNPAPLTVTADDKTKVYGAHRELQWLRKRGDRRGLERQSRSDHGRHTLQRSGRVSDHGRPRHIERGELHVYVRRRHADSDSGGPHRRRR